MIIYIIQEHICMIQEQFPIYLKRGGNNTGDCRENTSKKEENCQKKWAL